MTVETTPPVPEGWCGLDDYFVRGTVTEASSEKIRIHKHISRTQVEFQDGTRIGTVFTEDKPE